MAVVTGMMMTSSLSRQPLEPFSGSTPMTSKLTLLTLIWAPTGLASPKSSRATVSPNSATFCRARNSSSVKKRPRTGLEARMVS
ncbi:hypothetical protein D3C83_110980 [compost metagenome]